MKFEILQVKYEGDVLIPGITEIRPASALPVVFGLLFGPAGAWGAAIGNLIGDFFGTIGIGSLFGFVGNFFFAYVPYKLWNSLLTKADDKEPNLKSGRKVVAYIVAALSGSVACGLFIAWGLDLLKMVPFAALGTIIAMNNSVPSIILGLPLLAILYPRIKKWDLLWTDIIPEEELPKSGKLAKVGAILMLALSLWDLREDSLPPLARNKRSSLQVLELVEPELWVLPLSPVSARSVFLSPVGCRNNC